VHDFLFVIIQLFSLALTVATLQAEICRCERFLNGVGTIAHFLVEGDVAHQPLLGGRKLGRIALSCGIKILPVGSLD